MRKTQRITILDGMVRPCACASMDLWELFAKAVKINPDAGHRPPLNSRKEARRFYPTPFLASEMPGNSTVFGDFLYFPLIYREMLHRKFCGTRTEATISIRWGMLQEVEIDGVLCKADLEIRPLKKKGGDVSESFMVMRECLPRMERQESA